MQGISAKDSVMKAIIQEILSKILSGRWILTVAGAVVFTYMAIQGTMKADDTKMILGIIITFYFTKPRIEDDQK